MPFQHPALETLEYLTERSKAQILSTERMAMLAESYGLLAVVRWQPKNVNSRLPKMYLQLATNSLRTGTKPQRIREAVGNEPSTVCDIWRCSTSKRGAYRE